MLSIVELQNPNSCILCQSPQKEEKITSDIGYFLKRLKKGGRSTDQGTAQSLNLCVWHSQRYIPTLHYPGWDLVQTEICTKETLIITRSVSQHTGQHHFLGSERENLSSFTSRQSLAPALVIHQNIHEHHDHILCQTGNLTFLEHLALPHLPPAG